MTGPWTRGHGSLLYAAVYSCAALGEHPPSAPETFDETHNKKTINICGKMCIFNSPVGGSGHHDDVTSFQKSPSGSTNSHDMQRKIMHNVRFHQNDHIDPMPAPSESVC